MLVPPPLPPLAIDPASLLAPLGIAVLTVTLLRRYRLKTTAPRKAAAPSDPGVAVREAVRESAGEWELRLHDAGRAAEASLNTRAAELSALAERAETAAERLRVVGLPPEDADAPVTLPIGEERVRRHLRQAGYDDRQIDVILSRDGEGERERAA
ncbi:hypothetical protein [Alienimonas sp. DA493]|uniref:hypothetical protein n=1 Tax=Alienimonas sp. DA493 TaxID=3373605 RepID=UPI003754DA80